MAAQQFLWTVAAVALAIALFSGFAEYRRQRRKNLDRVGWMPWNLIQAMAGLIAILAFAYSLNMSGG